MTAMQRGRMPEGWANDLSDEYDWIPLRLSSDFSPDQRIDPTVNRGRVPRMGAHPGAAVHRRQQAGAAAP